MTVSNTPTLTWCLRPPGPCLCALLSLPVSARQYHWLGAGPLPCLALLLWSQVRKADANVCVRGGGVTFEIGFLVGLEVAVLTRLASDS